MSQSQFDARRPVGELVRERPATACVFEERDIDYCCHGDRSLEVAAAAAGVDLETLREDLRTADAPSDAALPDWDTLPELADHIVSTHHEFLRAELPTLAKLVTKVRAVHGEAHPELKIVHRTFNDLADDLLTHTAAEEAKLFPLLADIEANAESVDLDVSEIRSTIDEFEDDHSETSAALHRIKVVTDTYTPPEDACASYERMLDGLERLERDVYRHVHKENNILFPDVNEQLPTHGN